jgi:hypothetical protein
MSSSRRFPPPWSVEDIGACFIVKDSTGQKTCCGVLRGGAGMAIII